MSLRFGNKTSGDSYCRTSTQQYSARKDRQCKSLLGIRYWESQFVEPKYAFAVGGSTSDLWAEIKCMLRYQSCIVAEKKRINNFQMSFNMKIINNAHVGLFDCGKSRVLSQSAGTRFRVHSLPSNDKSKLKKIGKQFCILIISNPTSKIEGEEGFSKYLK
jgi:hypothetical protein